MLVFSTDKLFYKIISIKKTHFPKWYKVKFNFNLFVSSTAAIK